MFPSRGGMLNVNSLSLVFTLSSKEKTDFYLNPFLVALPLPNRKLLLLAILMKIQARGQQTEMDLNEFLQQMEILKDNSQAEVSQVAECDSTPLWKEQEETGSEASTMHFDSSNLESYGDLEYDLGFPSIWNFCGILDE